MALSQNMSRHWCHFAHDHWRRGHKQMCKKIHRGGNAEQYYANKKYKEAVAVAVAKCADDTKGQTCYICMEGAERRHTANEGLVRCPNPADGAALWQL